MITGRPMSAGDLRETITIKTVTETRGSTGEVLESPSTVFTARAKVEPLRGREAALMQQTQAMSDYRITIRDRGVTVLPQYEVTWGSQTFDIQAVIPIGAEGRFIELMCKERFSG